jgi:hypothetical protein
MTNSTFAEPSLQKCIYAANVVRLEYVRPCKAMTKLPLRTHARPRANPASPAPSKIRLSALNPVEVLAAAADLG